MAEVVHRVESTGGEGAFDFFNWLIDKWGYIVFALIIIILGIVIYVILKKWEEERQEKDDPVYEGYKNLCRDCSLNRDTKRIKKAYSLVNLLWLGLPLVRPEHSARIVNYNNQLLGFYRGHAYSQDGYFNILMYKDKNLIFFENKFLLRCPVFIKTKVKKRDEKGKVLKDEDGKTIVEDKSLNYRKWIQELSNGDFKIIASNLEQRNYFRYPIYLTTTGELIDIRKETGADIVDMTYNTMLGRVLSEGASMVEKAMTYNPNVKYEQMTPEKTQAEKKEDLHE